MFQEVKIVLIISILIIGAFGLSAQTDSIVSTTAQGEIVISKSDLIKFLDKIAKARKDKIEFELENIYIKDLTTQYPFNEYGINSFAAGVAAPLSGTTPLQSMSRDELLREVEVLTSRLNAIAGYAGTGSSTTFSTTPGYNQGGGYYPYQMQAPLVGGMPLVTANNGELRWKIDSLQREVSLLSNPNVVVENQEEISRLNNEIDRKQDSLMMFSPLTPEAKEIVRSYGTSQMKVFFDNDVSDISPRFLKRCRAATVLRRNPQLAVVLKGFASPIGSPRYNYDLSMRRNEAVKRMLIDYGVFPDQISSVFYGEDKTSSISEARRVDIKFIIK